MKFACLSLVIGLVTSTPTTKVINGSPTNGEIWRGVVMVQSGAGSCSGAWVHPHVILTAAHCCSGSQTGMKAFTGPDSDIPLGDSLNHKSASPLIINNDVCMIHMADEKPADLPHYDVHVANVATPCDSVIVGYGLNESTIIGGSGFGEARYGLTSINAIVQPNQILVGARAGTNPQQNACNGDSGGPVFAPSESGLWMIHGVTSMGQLGCPVDSFAIYANVATNVDWIRETAAEWGYDFSGTGGNRTDASYEYEA
jgi:hypothetical protein